MVPRPARVLLLLLAAPSTFRAQGAVGSVGEITVIGTTRRCPDPRAAATVRAVRIRRSGRDTLLRHGGTTRVLLGDEYRVHRHTDVRLLIGSSPPWDGVFTLAPQLMCPLPGARVTLTPFVQADSGAYEIARSRDGPLRFGVISGGAFIQWKPGGPPLVFVAGGHVGRITGTELAIAADSTGRLALLYVLDGSVSFAGDIVAGAGEVVELREGAAPRRIPDLARDMLREADTDARFHRDAFSRPPPGPLEGSALPPRTSRSIWTNPWTYAVAVGLGTTTYCLTMETKCGLVKRKRSGTVAVLIPL